MCTLFALTLVSLPETSSAIEHVVPTQWIAKQYTELLGRAPTKNEFDRWARFYEANACSPATLAVLGRRLARSSEFASIYPEHSRRTVRPWTSRPLEPRKSFRRRSRDRRAATKDALFKAIRTTALVRATFNHDVNEPWDWDSLVAPYIDGVKDWTDLTDEIYFRMGFIAWVVPRICSTTSAGYGFAYSPPLDLRALTGNGASRTQAQLQADLDAAAVTGGSVALKPGEVVRIGGTSNANQMLVVPAGVTLRTRGSRGPRSYAAMGRIVPATNGAVCDTIWCNNSGLVYVEAGATVHKIWVDGLGTNVLNFKQANLNIGGSSAAEPTTVSHNRVSNPVRDGTAIRIRGYSTTGIPCEGARVTNNLITAYSSAHEFDGLGQAQWADGIAVFCEDATVRRNTLVDVSDTGIMLYGSYNRENNDFATQSSQVVKNTVISVGLDAHVAFGADGAGECLSTRGWYAPCFDGPNLAPTDPTAETTRPFQNAAIRSNEYWSSQRTSFDVGLMIGSGPRAGDHSIGGRAAAGPGTTSIKVSKNVSTPDTRVNLGITVMGMRDAVVTRNSQTFVLVDGNPAQEEGKCAVHGVVVGNEDAESLRSDLVGIAVDESISGCVTGAPNGSGMEIIGVAADGSTLIGIESGRPFIPFGMSFSSPRGGPLVEQRWEDGWDDVVADLRELKRMGATFTRVRLQFRPFIDPPSAGHPNGTPNEATFANLAKFTRLAAQTGLYLSFSGLRIQRDSNADDWYSNATQEERWSAQATYWAEIAKTVGTSPSVAWYDLMNEPVVPTEDIPEEQPGWCHPNGLLGGNCFTQFITRTPAGDPMDIAQEWMNRLADAITAEGDFHLISIGNLSFLSANGFAFPCIGPFGEVPADDPRDFYSVHVYPRMRSVGGVSLGRPTIDDWIQAVKACKPADRPMIIEEVSNFGVSATDVADFILGSWPEASGWSGHYYTRTPEQLHGDLFEEFDPSLGLNQSTAYWAAALDRVMYREWMGISIFRTQLVGGGTVQP